MVERGPKLSVDRLSYQSKMIFLALLIIRSNFFSSKAFFPTKEQNNEKLGQNLRLGPCLAMCIKKGQPQPVCAYKLRAYKKKVCNKIRTSKIGNMRYRVNRSKMDKNR